MAGSISFTADTLVGTVPGVSGSGSLASIKFSAFAKGTSPLELSNVILLDSSGNEITPVNTADSQVDIRGTPHNIPEPSSLWLVVVGVIGIGRRRWRRMLVSRQSSIDG